MNINSIGSGDAMNSAISPLRSAKQTQIEAQDVKSTKTNNKNSGTQADNQLRTEQNSQLKNDVKLQVKQKEEEKKQPTMKDAQKMVDELNDYMDDLQTSLGFSVTRDPDSQNQIVFQIKEDRKSVV